MLRASNASSVASKSPRPLGAYVHVRVPLLVSTATRLAVSCACPLRISSPSDAVSRITTSTSNSVAYDHFCEPSLLSKA